MNDSALNKGLNRNTMFALAMVILLLAPMWACSQTNVTRSAPARYLLVVETSHSMKSRSDGVVKTVANLLFNGMSGQIKTGDSIGVWTYNQELYSGRLPLQRWSSLMQQDVASAILNFLKEQKYEKPPAFSSVQPALQKVIKDSELITVILISSGEEPMTGTPFDDKINELYGTWREEQQKSRMPFVTVLRAKRGTIIGYSVIPSPWQVEMPAWPPDPVVKASEPTPTPAKVQPSTVPPLIVTGKKPKPIEATNSSELATTTRDAAPITNTTISSPKAVTNAPADSGISEIPPLSAQKPATDPAREVGLNQNNALRAQETPQSEPVKPLVNEPVATNQVPKSETLPHSAAIDSSASAPVEVPQNHTTPQDVSTGVATPANGLFSNKIIWMAGLAVLGIACIALIAFTRRPRSKHISLITHSLEREKKQ